VKTAKIKNLEERLEGGHPVVHTGNSSRRGAGQNVEEGDLEEAVN